MLSIEATIRSDDAVTIAWLNDNDETIKETSTHLPGIWEATSTPESLRNVLVAANLTPRFTDAANYYSQGYVDGEWVDTFSVSGPVEDDDAYEWTFEFSTDGQVYNVTDFGKGSVTESAEDVAEQKAADNLYGGKDEPGIYRLREYYGDSENGILTKESIWDTRPEYVDITLTVELAKALDKESHLETPPAGFALWVPGNITGFYWQHGDEYLDELVIDVDNLESGPFSLVVASVEACEESGPYEACEAPFVTLLGIKPESHL